MGHETVHWTRHPSQLDKWLVAMLLYGGALRLLESLRLRAKDLDLERGESTVRQGKGDKDRVTTIPRAIVYPLQEHLERIKAIHQQDVADGYGRVELPHAQARKYPSADREWCWQFVFPQECSWRNSKTGDQNRHHLNECLYQRSLKITVREAASPSGPQATRFVIRLQRTC